MPEIDPMEVLGPWPELKPGPDSKCPKCGEVMCRDEVDVGVGIIHGPYGCRCGYSEWAEYDRTRGTNDATQEGPEERWFDQWGGSHSRERLRENLDRFGLGDVVDEVFEKKTSST